jgi:hypothetical protein
MQLNDILEENSIRAISQKTKISEENLENLLAKRFENLKKIKTMGFISIIEREYNADLGALREDAQEYYADIGEDTRITLGMPIVEEKKGTSKIFLLIIFGLLGYATWYFLTQFDKKHLSELIPFVDEATIESFVGHDEKQADVVEELSIAKVSTKEAEVAKEETPAAITAEVITDDESVVVAETVTDITPTSQTLIEPIATKMVSIVPVSRLWFGVIDMATNERDHFSISDAYELDVSNKSWLVATSSAPFSLQEADVTKEFNDAKEHYFKIDKNGIVVLSKSEYVTLGGWAQW